MTDYNKLKVTELKEVLKERGIPSTGLSRKAQIIEALEAHDVTSAPAEAGEEAGGDGGAEEASGDVQDAPAEGNGEPAHDIAEEESKAESSMPIVDEPAQDDALPDAPPPALESSVTELEKNEPVSKEPSMLNTPERVSPAAESMSSDTRKRKRRSPTPPTSQETVNKKLKSAEEVIKLPEDEVMEDAPAPVLESQEGAEVEPGTKTAMPSSVGDDVMDITSQPPAEEGLEEQPRSGSPMRTTPPPEDTADRPRSALEPEPAPEERSGPPSTHPSTRALYIRDLVRPLQPQQLRDHLIDITGSPSSDTTVKTFHLNALRTHAFAVFETLEAASTARAALHGCIWPDEPARKELWVDFVPEGKVQDWIDEELSSGGRRDAKKWEIIYDTDEDGRVIASHQEVTSLPPAPGIPRQPSFSTTPSAPGPAPPQGQGMPNAPLGPRADRPSASTQRPPQPSPRDQPKPSSATFDMLDQRFNHTTTKPKLYWLPVDGNLVDNRLRALEDQTSRDWDNGRAMRDATPVEAQLRRYTFEDGDRVVDNGADIPSFRSEGGRPPGAPPRGRGGYRGRR